MTTNETLVTSVKEMLKHIQDLHRILDEDKEHFVTKNIQKITESNQTKSTVLHTLTQLINQLNKFTPMVM